MVVLRKASGSAGEFRLANLLSNIGRPRLGRGRRSHSVVGVDIQPGYVAAASARANGGLVVERAAVTPLDAETVREGEVLNVEALAGALKELFGRSALARRVRLGVANQRTVMRVLEVPPFSDRRELEAAVRFQAEDQLPMPLANAALDFRPVGVVDTAAGARQRVLLVAAQLDTVNRLLEAVRSAGLTPAGVDLSAFALVRALAQRATSQAQAGSRTVLLNVGGLANLVISDGLECRFTRVLSRGLEAIAAEVAERRALPIEQARQLLRQVAVGDHREEEGTTAAQLSMMGSSPYLQDAETLALQMEAARQEHEAALLAQQSQDPSVLPEADPAAQPLTEEAAGVVPLPDTPYAEPSPSPASVDPSPPTESSADTPSEPTAVGNTAIGLPFGASEPAREQAAPQPTAVSPELEEARLIVEAGVRSLAGEVRNTLDFFAAQEAGPPIQSVVLSGPALDVPGFGGLLERYLGLPVESDQVRGVGIDAFGTSSAHFFAIAAGLAVEEVLV